MVTLLQPIGESADMGRLIATGFGEAVVTRNGITVLDGEKASNEATCWADCLTFNDAEKLAAADPDNDWRVCLNAALYSATYQRHGPNRWMLVEKGEGFA